MALLKLGRQRYSWQSLENSAELEKSTEQDQIRKHKLSRYLFSPTTYTFLLAAVLGVVAGVMLMWGSSL